MLGTLLFPPYFTPFFYFKFSLSYLSILAGPRGSKGSPGPNRYGGVSAFGGLGAVVANKANLKKANQ